MRRSPVYWCLILVLCFISAVSYAQSASTATIVGTVLDPQGAVIGDAKVTATNVATGVDRSTNSTSNGEFTLPFLPPGTYDVKVEAKGFAIGRARGVKLNVGGKQDLNFKLTVAGAAQTVEVTAEAPLIETTKTEVSSSVTDLDMQRMPTLAGGGNVANDYAQLAVTAPGVKLDTSGLTFFDLIGPGSVNNRGNLYNVDGGNITDQVTSGRDGLGASVDEVQEFQVLTNNYNAEYGQAGGLILNAVTKSGSNGVHGDGHMYFRGRNFGASLPFYNLALIQNQDSRCPNIANNDVSGCPRAPFHRQEGGFTLGGPFIKDKLFWFVNYELSHDSHPLVITPPGGAQTLSQPVNNLLYSGKIDYHVSTNHNLSIRYNVDRAISDNVVLQTGNAITPDSLVSLENHNAGLNVGFVSSITPTLVNEARFVFTRFVNSTPDKTTIPGQQHANFYTGANFCCPQGALQKRYQYIDNLTWTHGKHSYKTGFSISYYPWFSLFPQFHFGQYGNFTGNVPGTFTVAFGPGEVTSKDNIYGFYGQDTWHVSKNFTVNYGLRWDFEAGAFKGGKIKKPDGTCVQGNGIIPACSSDKNNFQPRLGFTYQPWDKWLIKGGAAEVTQLAFNNVVLDSLNFDGTTLNTVVIDGSTPAGAAVLAAFPNAPSAALLAPFAPSLTSFGRVRPIASNLRNPELRMFNFGVQREFGKNFVAEAQYIGQFGFGLFGERDTNYPVIAADPAHPGFFYFRARPDSRFTAVRTNENSRTSHYNGLLVSMQKRMSNHVQFTASYTWSHALTSSEDFFGLSEPGDPRNIGAEMGPAFNDIRHAANFGVVFDTAKLTERPVVRWFTNDVLLGWVGQLQSGRPYPVSTSTTPFLNARFFGAGNETQQRPNVLPDGTLSAFGVPSADGLNANFGPGGVAACITAGFPAALCNSLQNTFIAPADASGLGPIDSLTGDIVDFQQINGNLQRDAGRSLPFYKVDLRLTKSFRIPKRENIKLELEADAFNIFNHSNFLLNNTNDALSLLTLSLTPTGTPAADFFTCTGCLRPTGQYVGTGGQVLTVQDMLKGRTSPNLLQPIFAPNAPAGTFLGGIGDPASTDFPRIFQLSFRVRF